LPNSHPDHGSPLPPWDDRITIQPKQGEFPHLRRIHERFKDKSFVMLSISLDDDCEAVRKMIAQEKLPWRHICEGGWESPLASLYNVLGIPRTVLIGPGGRIVAKGLRNTEMDPAIERLEEPFE
jgi:hypothetical protein